MDGAIAPSDERALRKKRILLADDEEVVRKTIRLVLSFQGYDVVDAVDGEDAMSKFIEAGAFDLIMLDVDMPRLGGLEVLKRIRENQPTAKVIVLSGMPHDPKLPGVVFIQKPFDYHPFLKTIREMLGENG